MVIIGSGPAGHTPALHTARAQLRPPPIGSTTIVGDSLTTTTVENHPSFPESVNGPDLMERMRTQALKFGPEMIDDDTVSVDPTGPVKPLTDSEGTTHRTQTANVATGSDYHKLGLPREKELSDRGPS